MLKILLDEEREGLKITPQMVRQIIDEALDHYGKHRGEITKTETSLILLLKFLKDSRMTVE